MRHLVPQYRRERKVITVDGAGETNPLYWRLIRTVEEKIGVPMVMNTSFNLKGEPLVNSPLDALAIGRFLMMKAS